MRPPSRFTYLEQCAQKMKRTDSKNAFIQSSIKVMMLFQKSYQIFLLSKQSINQKHGKNLITWCSNGILISKGWTSLNHHFKGTDQNQRVLKNGPTTSCFTNKGYLGLHSVEISYFFYHSEFTCHQFRGFHRCKMCLFLHF